MIDKLQLKSLLGQAALKTTITNYKKQPPRLLILTIYHNTMNFEHVGMQKWNIVQNRKAQKQRTLQSLISG